MASNGLIKKAKKGRCRLCQRQRCTDKHVSPVGEISHGFATGYIWECNDAKECADQVETKLKNPMLNLTTRALIELGVKQGKAKEYRRIT